MSLANCKHIKTSATACRLMPFTKVLEKLEVYPSGKVIGRYSNGDSADLTGKIMFDPGVPVFNVKKP